MATKTKAPTGLTISRNGNSFKCSWKCADKNYNDGQGFRYLLTGMKARASLSIGKGDRSKALTINPNNYYPKTTKYLTKVTFDVRGNCAKYKKNKKNIDPTVSSWASKTLVLTAPARPTVTEKLDDTLSDTTAFTWEVAVSDTNVAWFTDVQWESMLVKDSNETNGAKLSWSSSALGYQTGTGGATGTKTITESTGITALASFTRWFRIRSRGPAGASAWTYIKHIYAKPNSAVITKADAKPLQNGYLTEVYWTLALPNARPIDKTIVQYQVATPADMLTRPEENSWTDANVSKDIRYDAENSNSAALFNVDGLMGLDKCLFVRVNTQHDTEANTTLGDPALAYIGRLTAPRSLSVTLNHTSHKATITATNESAVADSFMVVKYIPASDPDGFIVGVMTASGSITVQCPDWSQETGYRFEVYTAVGTYTETVRADGVSSYEVNALMVSDSVNNGGVVPLPPENVSVSATSIPGTARVVWDWAWAEATSAEIAWADHPDAWESTDAPETYEVGVVNASAWNISGLETGVAWYIRARLLQKVGDTEVASAWSDMQTITLSSAPSIPVLSLSAGVITADGSVTASWVYSTTDGTGQSHATIAELTYEDGEPVYTKLAETETEQHITISAEVAGWQTGESHSLVVQVMSASGRLSDGWSDPVAVIVADPLTAEITATSLINADIEVNPREFSGDIVTFETEMEEAVTSLTATIEPIQDLNGYTHPWVGGAGKNKADLSAIEIGKAWNTGANSARATVFFLIQPNTTYTVSVSGGTFDAIFWGEVVAKGDLTNKRLYAPSSYPYTVTTKAESNVGLIQFNKTDISSSDFTNVKMQVELGSTATAFEPYSNICPISGWDSVDVHISPTESAEDGTTHTATFEETVYGGTVDLVSGVLTVDRAMVDLGTLTWNTIAQYGDGYFNARIGDRKQGQRNLICSNYAVSSAGGASAIADGEIIGGASNPFVYIHDSRYKDASAFKKAMNGVQLVYELATPQTYQLTPQTIATLEGVNNVWGDSGSVDVRIAEMVERDANVLDKMPLTVTVSGADVGDTTTLIIERATDYQIEQPDEKTLNGYEGEAVFVQSMTGAGTFTIDGADLIGMLNDGATYRIIATVQDGLGQSATADIITFLVRWAHQALIPSGQVSSDTEHMVAIIKPIAPTGTEDGDTCDIYRLSIDRPLLIYEGATFGETYVDPFPTVGENGGHRIVFKSKDGDYITADETMAWTDFGEDEGDFLPNRSTIIDFGTGRVNLDYDIDLSSDWSKDVEVTNYLGGAVQGDWNPAINRTGKVSAKALLTDVETIEGMRRLADYPGICHVRTNEGSSYAADVQVSEGVSVDSGHKVASFDISITKVDPESLDGLTYAEWLATQQEEA